MKIIDCVDFCLRPFHQIPLHVFACIRRYAWTTRAERDCRLFVARKVLFMISSPRCHSNCIDRVSQLRSLLFRYLMADVLLFQCLLLLHACVVMCRFLTKWMLSSLTFVISFLSPAFDGWIPWFRAFGAEEGGRLGSNLYNNWRQLSTCMHGISSVCMLPKFELTHDIEGID